METPIDRITTLFFAFKKMFHEQREQKKESTCSYMHLVTLGYIKKEKPLMKDIASLLGITPPSATSLVNTLVRTQLVKRQADTKDRRTVRIVIMPKGEKYLETYKRKVTKRLQENLQRLSLGEQKQLAVLLEKITKVTA